MKLSMNMVANRLYGMDIEINISESDPIRLKSARRVYATDCVYVFSSGKDTICQAESGVIKLKDVDVSQGFEIIQDVFDFYRDWYANVKEAMKKQDYQKMIDLSETIFHNPFVLMDSSSRVLGMRYYDAEDIVDEEWTYMQTFGHTSIQSIQYMRTHFPNRNFGIPRIQEFQFSGEQLKNQGIVYGVRLHDEFIGRFVLLSHERVVNNGDAQLIEILAECFLETVKGDEKIKTDLSFNTVYYRLLNGEPVSEEALTRELACNEWKIEDLYQVILVKPMLKVLNPQVIDSLEIVLKQAYPECVVLRKEKEFLLILNVTHDRTFQKEKINVFLKEEEAVFSKSLHLFGIYNLFYLYDQAKEAMNINKWDPITKTPEELIDFYYLARDYIIINEDKEKIYHACHPDIMMLWERERKQQDGLFETFVSYLDNNCSIKNTSDAMYLHRNTLIYRIQKIMKMFRSDVNDIYTRNYMKLSIRVLQLFQKYNKEYGCLE